MTIFDVSVCHPLNTDSPLALCHYHITFLMCGSRESTDSWQMAVDRSRGALNGASIDPQGLWIPSIHKPRDPIEFPEWSQQSISLVHWWILSHKHVVGVQIPIGTSGNNNKAFASNSQQNMSHTRILAFSRKVASQVRFSSDFVTNNVYPRCTFQRLFRSSHYSIQCRAQRPQISFIDGRR